MDMFSSNRSAVIKAKAGILCKGIHLNDVAKTIYAGQNPCGDCKTGNVGLHLVLAQHTYVLATVSHDFDRASPFTLRSEAGCLRLFEGEQNVCSVEAVTMPHWYASETSTVARMPSIFLHEGSRFLHQAYSGCDYPSRKVQCKFCGTGEVWKIGTAKEVAETVRRATQEQLGYHVCLGGGTRLPSERNVRYFSECISEIRGLNVEAPVWVEMAPPPSNEHIDQLISAGATSFGFNT